MYVCMCVCVYVCMCLCVYVYVYMCVCVYVCMYVSTQRRSKENIEITLFYKNKIKIVIIRQHIFVQRNQFSIKGQ